MKILVVDDHPMVRKGLSSTLIVQDGIKEVKEAANITEALKIIGEFKPNILLVDLMLGQENGLGLIKSIKGENRSIKSIVLTSSSRKDDFLRAQQIGVEGYILKEAFPEDIIYALRVVARGKNYIDPEFSGYNGEEKKGQHIEELTPREREILLEIGKGYSNNKIAKTLYISENTVKKHVSNILAKLGLNQRLEAALYINNLTMGV